MTEIIWGDGDFPLRITASDDAPAMLSIASTSVAREPLKKRHRARPAAVEILVLGEGRALNNTRAIRTAVGDRMRLVSHSESEANGTRRLEIVQRDTVTGLEAVLRIEQFTGVGAYRATTTIRNGGDASVLLQHVTSASVLGLTGHLGDPHDIDLWTARSEWCAESRWSAVPIAGREGTVDINTPLHGHFARGSIALTSRSTWSSGEYLPTGVLENRETGRSLAWQIENNGPWRWEIDTLFDPAEWLALELLGPTDLDHAWTHRLEPGESFETVPVSFSLAEAGLQGAIAELTAHRRRSHLPSTADSSHPLVFNDYMNALMGDPTTQKLLPLIDAAAAAGAQYFCIDAGWYDDGGDWWPSVGAWQPSGVRFGERGLSGVIEHIRERGMMPGLWVEPEVIGVLSPIASQLPEEAFMRRAGVRIVEHDRYFLDFRSPAARGYLDEVFRRLVDDYGARYFKWDYNVTPGSGPDADASGPGDGLLGHTRAHLALVEALRERYPEIIIESCSSGAQRMDAAIVARYDLQSTSDQQDYRLYPPIAASAPMSMPIEQAGNWAYPQSEWSDEQIAFTLVTGLSGRLYLSGNIDRLDERQRSIVAEATTIYPEVIAHHSRAVPEWPLGLPGWEDDVVALGSADGHDVLLFVWNRDESGGPFELPVQRLMGQDASVTTVFPTGLTPWQTAWNADAGVLTVDPAGAGESARVIRLRPGRPDAG